MSDLNCEAHVNVQHNELVLLNCNGVLKDAEIEAQGGVLAGNLKVENVDIKGTVVGVVTHCIIAL